MAGKKLMVLGGSINQVPLIRSAQEQGYITVVCDYKPSNPGSQIADIYYEQDFMDFATVLQIAQKEGISGVVTNSEPAVHNATRVAEAMNLPGNPVSGIETLLNKNKFRKLQHAIGVYAPKSFESADMESVFREMQNLKEPIIIKPSESSGTRGATKIFKNDRALITEAFQDCKSQSRNGLVTVEEFVEMPVLSAYDADIFVVGDEILWDGLYSSDRLADAPMVPCREVLPLRIAPEKIRKIKLAVEKIIKAAGICLGEFNVETYLTNEDEVFVIEINPRQGGNNIPELIKDHCGVDMTKLLVTTAMGDNSYFEALKGFVREHKYITQIVVFSRMDGVFDSLVIDTAAEPYVNWVKMEAESGAAVRAKRDAEDSIACVELVFPDAALQDAFTANIEQYIYPLVKEVGNDWFSEIDRGSGP